MTTAHRIQFQAKGYATRENAIKAVEKVLGKNHEHYGSADVQWLIAVTDEGRFLPVFLGERCLQHGIHTRFHVAG